MIECKGIIQGNYLCGMCMDAEGDTSGTVYWVVEDGDEDNEEFICEICAKRVFAQQGGLGHVRIASVKRPEK